MINPKDIIEIAEEAGRAIMTVYNDPQNSAHVDYKEDNSPLTLADKASHMVISTLLAELHPDIPIVSEEGIDIEYAIRKDFDRFWLVDPLDGTKEFIRRNGEFTVNIALIEKSYPVLGVIHVPFTETSYWGSEGVAKRLKGDVEEDIKVAMKDDERTAARSRSHASPEEEEVLKRYKVNNTVSRGSALKFCVVAEGMADLYYRHGPTMEWDTAAGQAIIEAAGGHFFVGNQPVERFHYNKESLLNPGFLCLGFSPS